MKKHVLSVDIGTSSLKAALIDSEGEVLGFYRRELLLGHTDHAALEWKDALADAIRKIYSTPQPHTQGICISGNGPTIVASSGETLLWNEPIDINCDGSGKSSLFIPRILGFMKKFSKAYSEAENIFSGPEFLMWQTSGTKVTVLPEERFAQAYWSASSLLETGFSISEAQKLCPFVKPGHCLGNITQEFLDFLKADFITDGNETTADYTTANISQSITGETKIYAGAPDFVSALAGTATLEPGTLCDRAGSSEGINYCTDRQIFYPGTRCLPSVIPGLWNISVLLPKTGTSFADFKKQVERMEGQELSYEQLIYLFYNSEGENPLYDQGKYMMIKTALDVRDGLNVLAKMCRDNGLDFPKEMTMTGGQAKNPLWCRMKSDITGIDIAVNIISDSELLGDAVFAFTGMGEFSDFKKAASALCKKAAVFQAKKE